MTLSIFTSIQCTAFFNHFCLTKGNPLYCIEIRIKGAKRNDGKVIQKILFVCLFGHFQKMMDELFCTKFGKSGRNGLLKGQLIL